jgi:hypothetical protein
MPTVLLQKNEAGKLAGVTPKDERAYAKFLKRILGLIPLADCISFSWREPRSGPYHRRHFAMLNALFEAQEQFNDPDSMHNWLKVGAGYCDLVPGPGGQIVALPRSIAWDNLDQAEFEPIHEAMFAFAYSEHARRFLWPHLSDEKSWEMLDSVLLGFM